MPLDETYMRDNSYGPAGYIASGVEFTKRQRDSLAASYRKLEHALTLLRGEGAEGMSCYLVLLAPYLGDPGDPALVVVWRDKKPRLLEWHDLAIEKLARYLRGTDLFVIFPHAMSDAEERRGEAQNAEIHAVYQRHRNAGLRRDDAVEVTASQCWVATDHVERVIEFRKATKPDECLEPGCGRAPFSGDLCMKHWQRQRRARIGDGAA